MRNQLIKFYLFYIGRNMTMNEDIVTPLSIAEHLVDTDTKIEFDSVEMHRAMAMGFKITHKFFVNDTWMALNKNAEYVFQDGVVSKPADFWTGKEKEEHWDDGWSIVKT
jgi:hypothetical protein